MSKKHLDSNLEIYFNIHEFNRIIISSLLLPSLRFKSSNYDLSKNEIMRASLRPNTLTLDNKRVYIKSNENAYLDKDEKNILKVNYCKLEH